MLANLNTLCYIPKMYRQWDSPSKPNKLLSIITVCGHGFHNGVMTYI